MIPVTITKENFIYKPQQDRWRENGDRHKRNAERYLAEGKPEYAAGSMRKAERNYKNAKLLDDILNPVLTVQAQQIKAQLDREFVEMLLRAVSQGDGGKPLTGLRRLR